MAESPVSIESHLRHLSLHAVKVFVRNLEESLRFYTHQLGFRIAFDATIQNGQRWVGVSPPDGTAVLTLVAPEPGSREHDFIGRPTGVVFVTDNVAAQYSEWRRRGVRFQYAPRLRHVRYAASPATGRQPPLTWGGVFTPFRDPDGNAFELVGLDEVSREVEAHRRAHAAKLESERRAAQELEIARSVQARLFPQTLPSMKTLDYAGVCIQAHQVGGDYYDFLDLGSERFALIVGDIAGKGMPAALLMANLQANLRSQCAIALDGPQRLLRSVNRLFHEGTIDSAYATLFFAEYDERTRHLSYVNCGHLPALLLRAGDTVEKLSATSSVLGLFAEWDCSVAECSISPGDILVLYTDGITESFNEAEEEFGERALIEAIRRHRHESPQALMESIVNEVMEFTSGEQHDDITLIVARCRQD